MKKISYPWKRLSPENLKVAQRIINITIDLLQMYSKRTINGIRLPIQKYSDNGLNFEDIESVLGKINGININNARILNSVKDLTHIGSFQIVPLYNLFPSEEELKNYLFLEIDSANELPKIKKIIDRALENNKGRKDINNFEIIIRDREIWTNNYLLSKPHAIGSNFEFFEYVHNNANKELKRTDLPESLRKEISGKTISKILNALGFKGEILKAFFPKRSKNNILFRNGITKIELEKSGINFDIFIQELRLANTKNNK